MDVVCLHATSSNKAAPLRETELGPLLRMMIETGPNVDEDWRNVSQHWQEMATCLNGGGGNPAGVSVVGE